MDGLPDPWLRYPYPRRRVLPLPVQVNGFFHFQGCSALLFDR